MSMFVKAFSAIYRHPAATQESTRVAGPPTSLPMKWKAWESRCGQEHPLYLHHSIYSPIGTSCQQQYDPVDCLSSSGRSNDMDQKAAAKSHPRASSAIAALLHPLVSRHYGVGDFVSVGMTCNPFSI